MLPGSRLTGFVPELYLESFDAFIDYSLLEFVWAGEAEDRQVPALQSRVIALVSDERPHGEMGLFLMFKNDAITVIAGYAATTCFGLDANVLIHFISN